MKPTTPLKLSSIGFAVLWTTGMLLSSGSIDRINFIILAVCGSLAGVAWYYAMRWVFQIMHMVSYADHSADTRTNT